MDASPPTAKVEQRGQSQSESLLFTLTNRGSCSTVLGKEKKRAKALCSVVTTEPKRRICFLFTHFNYISFVAGIGNSMLYKVYLNKIN